MYFSVEVCGAIFHGGEFAKGAEKIMSSARPSRILRLSGLSFFP